MPIHDKPNNDNRSIPKIIDKNNTNRKNSKEPNKLDTPRGPAYKLDVDSSTLQ